MPDSPEREDIHELAERGGVAMFLSGALLDEEVRALLRARWGTGTTLRTLSEETGVSTYRLRRVLDGDATSAEDTAALYLWAEKQPAVYVGAETVALAVLARWGFGSKAPLLRRALVQAVTDVYRANNLRLPRYVYHSLDAALPAKKRD